MLHLDYCVRLKIDKRREQKNNNIQSYIKHSQLSLAESGHYIYKLTLLYMRNFFNNIFLKTKPLKKRSLNLNLILHKHKAKAGAIQPPQLSKKQAKVI